MAAGGLARQRPPNVCECSGRRGKGYRFERNTHTLVRERGMRNEGDGWKRRRAERKEQDGEGTYDAVAHGKRERESRESERD